MLRLCWFMVFCFFTVLCHGTTLYDEQGGGDEVSSFHTDIELPSSGSDSGDEQLKKRKSRDAVVAGGSALGGEITAEHIDDLIEKNAIERLIKIYDDLHMSTKRVMPRSREGFDSVDESLFWRSDITADDQRIARLFFPHRYILDHYGRSFDRLNEAAQLCVLIAARHGYQLSREIMANIFPFQKNEKEIANNLRLRSASLSVRDKINFILNVPFSMNNQENVIIFRTDEGREILQQFAESSEEVNSLVAFNAAYACLLLGNKTNALKLFLKAGEKGMRRGFIEAANLFVNGKMEDLHLLPEPLVKSEKIETLKELLTLAGDDGRWYLADCYRHRWLEGSSERAYYDEYYAIVSNESRVASYHYEYALLHINWAERLEDGDADKISFYKIALDSLSNTMTLGRLEALPDMERVLIALDKLIKKHPSFKDAINLEEARAETAAFKEQYDRQLAISASFKQRMLNALLAK
jgi:hypothetical protein